MAIANIQTLHSVIGLQVCQRPERGNNLEQALHVAGLPVLLWYLVPSQAIFFPVAERS